MLSLKFLSLPERWVFYHSKIEILPNEIVKRLGNFLKCWLTISCKNQKQQIKQNPNNRWYRIILLIHVIWVKNKIILPFFFFNLEKLEFDALGRLYLLFIFYFFKDYTFCTCKSGANGDTIQSNIHPGYNTFFSFFFFFRTLLPKEYRISSCKPKLFY